MSTSTGIAGGVLGAGLTYAWLKPKIDDLKKENTIQLQQINKLYNEVQTLKSTVLSQKNIITQKDEAIRQKDNLISSQNTEIAKLQSEKKRVLSN